MKLYSFMPKELSELATQAVDNVIAQMYKDGDLSDEAEKKWSRRAVLIQEPGFIQRLFGKVFKKNDGLQFVIIERVTDFDDEEGSA